MLRCLPMVKISWACPTVEHASSMSPWRSFGEASPPKTLRRRFTARLRWFQRERWCHSHQRLGLGKCSTEILLIVGGFSALWLPGLYTCKNYQKHHVETLRSLKGTLHFLFFTSVWSPCLGCLIQTDPKYSTTILLGMMNTLTQPQFLLSCLFLYAAKTDLATPTNILMSSLTFSSLIKVRESIPQISRPRSGSTKPQQRAFWGRQSLHLWSHHSWAQPPKWEIPPGLAGQRSRGWRFLGFFDGLLRKKLP